MDSRMNVMIWWMNVMFDYDEWMKWFVDEWNCCLLMYEMKWFVLSMFLSCKYITTHNMKKDE